MNAKLIIEVCRIELQNASDILDKGEQELAKEILRCLAAYLNDITPKSLTDEQFQKLLDELYHISKLPPQNPQAADKD